LGNWLGDCNTRRFVKIKKKGGRNESVPHTAVPEPKKEQKKRKPQEPNRRYKKKGDRKEEMRRVQREVWWGLQGPTR